MPLRGLIGCVPSIIVGRWHLGADEIVAVRPQCGVVLVLAGRLRPLLPIPAQRAEDILEPLVPHEIIAAMKAERPQC